MAADGEGRRGAGARVAQGVIDLGESTFPAPPAVPTYGLSRAERRNAQRYRRMNAKAPNGLEFEIAKALTVDLQGKDIPPGDPLSKIVARESARVGAMAGAEGFSVDFDLPENTHKNMAKGSIFFVLKPFGKNRQH
jgi:hypothetical protein